jgi:Tol biopolymer transport system component
MPLIEDVAANPLTGGGQFDFSAAPAGPGTLVYVAGRAAAQTWQVAWLDASGNRKPLIGTPGVYALPRFSPDGRKLVFIGSDSIPHIYDLERETTTRVTSAGTGGSVTWAPDGKHVVFGVSGVLSWIRSDGAGGLQRLAAGKHSLSAWSISRDGHWLAYFETMPETGADLWILPLDLKDPDHPKPGEPQVFLRTQANELLPSFSPDGRWIAYRSDESGGNEIWVTPFPAGTGARWQISAGGGLYAVWSNNGRQLFYETTDYRIKVVDYRVDGDSFVPSKPRLWSDRQIFYPGVSNLDLAPDGQRFAVLTTPDAASGAKSSVRVTMLLNFFDELRRRMPASK